MPEERVRFTLRLPEDVEQAVREAADKKNVSRNEWVVRALRQAVADSQEREGQPVC